MSNGEGPNGWDRAQTVWDSVRDLDGAPEVEFRNKASERLFQKCLAIERSRPSDELWTDRHMDIMEFWQRWIQTIQVMTRENPFAGVANVAIAAAFRAGVDEVHFHHYILVASVIAANLWKRGDEIKQWLPRTRFAWFYNINFRTYQWPFPTEYLSPPPGECIRNLPAKRSQVV